MDFQDAARQLKEALRLRTEPLGVSFPPSAEALPDKTRRPSKVFGKKVTICQGVTMARVYGWPVGLAPEDLVCVPGMLAFGFVPQVDPVAELTRLVCEVGFHAEEGLALREVQALSRFHPGEIGAVYLAPLDRLALEPQAVVVYGNPAQLMRLINAAAFATGERVQGEFGGKIECSSYLIGPVRRDAVLVTIPGMGDRIFSMTQDDELVVSFPAGRLAGLLAGLREAGKKIGARYPITVYQNFSPEFPGPYKERALKWGILD
ncbi:MAG: hypothetical protein FJ128_07620 [Deltaproteobacteria bacterium]|nr:hypothetical protein [Deltaproteobacteria bacterium]